MKGNNKFQYEFSIEMYYLIFVDKIVNYDYDKGRKLLEKLIEHSIQSKYVYEHIWNNDDIVMWDNRCTMHSVKPYDNNIIKRIMHRVTLVGDKEPVMA